MKQLVAVGVLLMGLTACNPGTGPTPPEPSYPYNPNVNSTQQNDARVPYRGDWAFVAILADGTRRTGVAGILTRYNGPGLVNAGGGIAAWCLTAGCTTSDEQGTVIIGTAGTGTAATLSIGMVPKNQTTTRFVMSDSDGVVSVVENQATISGVGTWRDATGQDQNAAFGFVQIRSKSDLAPQSVALNPNQLAERMASAVSMRPSSPELKTTFERALAR